MTSNLRQSQIDDSQFNDWLARCTRRNPNLQPLADELNEFSEADLLRWIESALVKVVICGEREEMAFSPGELIIGTSPSGWQDDLLAVIALLEDSAKLSAVKSIVECFKGIAPQPNANDLSINGGKNWERYTVELMRLARDLRSPLCNREATPLDALYQLLTVKFPTSQAVFDEGIVLWRAFAHQISTDIEWATVFERHACFDEEYTPLVAFAHVVRYPSKALHYLSEWAPYRRYRRRLQHDGVMTPAAKDVLQDLYNTTTNVVRYAKSRGAEISPASFRNDPTYAHHSEYGRYQQVHRSIARAAEVAYEKEPVSLINLFNASLQSIRHSMDSFVPGRSSHRAEACARQ